jgi:ankyrin repeat protein
VDGSNQTAFHFAIQQKNHDAIKTLLKYRSKSSNWNSPDSKGMTPLLLAAELGQYKICEELIKAGADTKALTPTGNTVSPLSLRFSSSFNFLSLFLSLPLFCEYPLSQRIRLLTSFLGHARQTRT